MEKRTSYVWADAQGKVHMVDLGYEIIEYDDGLMIIEAPACCDECVARPMIQPSHAYCHAPPEDLHEAEEQGLVDRIYLDGRWAWRLV